MASCTLWLHEECQITSRTDICTPGQTECKKQCAREYRAGACSYELSPWRAAARARYWRPPCLPRIELEPTTR